MRRKKFMSLLMVMMLAVSMAAPCYAKEDAAEAAQISEEEKVEELENSMDSGEEDEAAAEQEEGFVIEKEGCKGTVRWCKNGEKNIYGILYLPEEYDGTQKYPTAILCHGFGDCHLSYDAYIPTLTANGIACYVFDFCTGGLKSYSDGEATDYSVITETEDLKAVMDFVKGLECVDTEQLILMGQSMGGLVSSLVAAERADEIAELVLFYPGLTIPGNMQEDYPTREDLPAEPTKFLKADVGPIFFSDVYDLDVYGTIGAYTGPVLLLHGTGDKLIPAEASEKAEEVYENAQLKIIEGANHGFPPLEDGTNVREWACNCILDFLTENGVIE